MKFNTKAQKRGGYYDVNLMYYAFFMMNLMFTTDSIL